MILNRRTYGKTGLASQLVLSLSYLIPGLLLPLHIYTFYYFWSDYKRDVDKHLCSCSCWDTVFKGSYESGVASYKHVYFNATCTAFKMWLLSIVFIIVLYESMKLLIWLGLQWKLRISMCIIFLASIFPHYYTWWCFMNYYNDEYYHQWYHQLVFSISEMFSSCMILYLCNISHDTTRYKLCFIIGIALIHVCVSSVDQFVSNVLQGEGYSHQIASSVSSSSSILCSNSLRIVSSRFIFSIFLPSPRSRLRMTLGNTKQVYTRRRNIQTETDKAR
uniref:Uncharacterized protein n=1 Tax=Cacopsylla melanoneura TaxID=428564 RepID=A0A8D8YUX8_9HEMI